MALSTATKIGLGVAVAGALAFLVLSDTGEGVLEYMYVDKVVDTDVPARVNGGELDISLLGMSYLDRFRSLRVEGDSMYLSR